MHRQESSAHWRRHQFFAGPRAVAMLPGDNWPRPYLRERGAYPLAGVRENKYWPPVAHVDHAYGDGHLVCVLPPVRKRG